MIFAKSTKSNKNYWEGCSQKIDRYSIDLANNAPNADED